MAAGSELTNQAIAPGSVPYGEKGPLQAGIAGAMQGAASGGSPAGAPAAPSAPQVGGNPLAALLGSDLSSPGGPVTSGLSVGPGPGPMQQDDPMLSDRANKLRMIATQAASPQLRALARTALRSMARGAV